LSLSSSSASVCRNCGTSLGQQTFNGKIALHFPGLDGLRKPIVWVFQTIAVCMDCGTAQFTIPEAERKQLGDREDRDFIEAAV
jgi:hypothetical protein